MDEFIDISYPIAIKEDKNGSVIRLIDFDKYFVGSSREKALTHLYIYLLNEINTFREQSGEGCEEFLRLHPATDIESGDIELFEGEILVTVETGYSNETKELDEFEQFYVDRYYNRIKEEQELEGLSKEEIIAKMVKQIEQAEKTAKELGVDIVYLKKR